MKSLGDVNHVQGAYHYALDLYNKALAVAKDTGTYRVFIFSNSTYLQIGNMSLQEEIHHGIALTANDIGEPALSMEHFEKAIQIARSMSDKYSETKLMYDMGLVLSRQAKFYKVYTMFHTSYFH